MTGRAYFRKYPSRIENLRRPHLLADRIPYMVVNVVVLLRIDYENFITDMTVERDFLEKSAPLCHAHSGGALPCVLVRQRNRKDGVLVHPDREGFVVWAAYIADVERVSD